MRVRPLALSLCVGLLAGLVATAQAAPPSAPGSDEIVVTGERLSPQQARERAIAFVRHTGIINNRESVARWIDPVCLRAIGLEPTNLQRVETKIRAIAETVGVPLAKPGCTPNSPSISSATAAPSLEASPRAIADTWPRCRRT